MTAGTNFGRLGRTSRVLAVLGLGGLMLGAHYTRQVGYTPQVPGMPAVVADIHSGAGAAATLQRWSSARSFRLVPAGQWGRFAALDSAEQLTILKLNRVDLAHARRRDLIVPDSIADELSYSPLPAYVEALATTPKFVLVSRRLQAFGAYEYGTLVRWGPTSTGKATTPTDAGLFFTNWKSRTTVSTDDPSWILDWYVNFIAMKGVAFHQYALPGRPASHGCVRLLEVDARWMYTWSEQWVPGRGSDVKRYGTPVLVTGDYDYRAVSPWLRVAEDPALGMLTADELAGALAPALPLIAARTPAPSGDAEWAAVALPAGGFGGRGL